MEGSRWKVELLDDCFVEVSNKEWIGRYRGFRTMLLTNIQSYYSVKEIFFSTAAKLEVSSHSVKL
jgi:hypothetical protein